MSSSINLALLKPTTQSSICSYSRGATAEADSALAVNGDLESEIAFHTAEEVSPWWEVDLVETCLVERIYIKNRNAEKHRFCNFTILHSLDRVHWDVAFTKCDPRQFRNIEIPLFEPVRCRYVRVRLDGREFLHLCEVQVYGHVQPPAASSDSLPLVASDTTNQRVTLFSILFNEGHDYLNLLIENLLHFTGQNEIFVINLSENVPIEIDSLPSISRVRFLRGQGRAVIGHTLLLGHLETFKWAEEKLLAFDYFVPISSNSLFLRRFRIDLVEQHLKPDSWVEWYIEPNKIIESNNGLLLETHDWWWARVETQKALLRFIQGTLRTNTIVPMQIEGLLAPAQHWAALADLAPSIEKLGKGFDKKALFPLEEVLPATFFAAAFGGNFTLVCHVLWHPFRTMVSMDQVIQPSWHFPPHISIAKWFDRQAGAPETAAVSTLRGRQMVEIISESLNLDSYDDVVELSDLLRLLTEGLDMLLIKRRGYRPDGVR